MTWPQAAALSLVTLYRGVLAPVLGGQCRFAPSCSEYARQAVLELGVVRGAWFSAGRLLRCHPFRPGGYDPPPRRRY